MTSVLLEHSGCYRELEYPLVDRLVNFLVIQILKKEFFLVIFKFAC